MLYQLGVVPCPPRVDVRDQSFAAGTARNRQLSRIDDPGVNRRANERTPEPAVAADDSDPLRDRHVVALAFCASNEPQLLLRQAQLRHAAAVDRPDLSGDE